MNKHDAAIVEVFTRFVAHANRVGESSMLFFTNPKAITNPSINEAMLHRFQVVQNITQEIIDLLVAKQPKPKKLSVKEILEITKSSVKAKRKKPEHHSLVLSANEQVLALFCNKGKIKQSVVRPSGRKSVVRAFDELVKNGWIRKLMPNGILYALNENQYEAARAASNKLARYKRWINKNASSDMVD